MRPPIGKDRDVNLAHNRPSAPHSRSSSEWDPIPLPVPIRISLDPPAGPKPAKPKPTDFFYDAWDMFLALEPKRAKKTSRAARKIIEAQKLADSAKGREGLNSRSNVAKSWEQAASACKAKVDAIIKECVRLNTKYRDVLFDMEKNPYCLDNLPGEPIDASEHMPPAGARRVAEIFENPSFTVNGQAAGDVHQGHVGDCWFLAALMAVTAKKDLIDSICVARDEKVGVYGFVFFRDGEWIYEVIDDKLLLRFNDSDNLDVVREWDPSKRGGIYIDTDQDKLREHLKKGGEALYFSHCKSNETWLPLIEKAYAKAHGDYSSIEGGWVAEGIEDLTGGVAIVFKSNDIMDKDRFWKEELLHVNEKYLFGGSSSTKPSKGVIENHAYAILRAYEKDDLRLLKLRNPWGKTEWQGDWSDGSKLWTPEMMKTLEHTFGDDGVFWISYNDFLKFFPRINRVRLFQSSDWQIAQQWTCVEVPWTVDYLDTKFQFTITQKCPIVLVLSQPDNRYFEGLEGRIRYALHFRVKRARRQRRSSTNHTSSSGDGNDHDEDGEESEDDYSGDEHGEDGLDRWIVRSMHNSGGSSTMTRSVSAEIDDLEPGTYDVIFKVTATREEEDLTAHDAVMKFAADRKAKLLDVGRRFDYAQTKGNRRAMEEAIQRRWKEEEREGVKDGLKTARLTSQMERARVRKRKIRALKAIKELHAEARMKREEAETKNKDKEEKANQNAADVDQPGGFRNEDNKKPDSKMSDTKKSKSGETNNKAGLSEAAIAEELSILNLQDSIKKGPQKSSSSDEADGEVSSRPLPRPFASLGPKAKASAKPSPAANQDCAPKPDISSENKQAEQNGTTQPALNSTVPGGEKAEEPARPDEEQQDGEAMENGEAEELYENASASGSEAEEDESLEPEIVIDDDDFDWDSDIDGPVPLLPDLTSSLSASSSDDEDGNDDQASSNRGSAIASLSGYLTQGECHKRQHRRRRGPNKKTSSASGTTNQLFAEDPWNAICVLGLRVYARAEKAAEVSVVRGEDG